MPAPFLPFRLPRARCSCRYSKPIPYGMMTDTDTPSGITRAQVAGTRRRGAVAWWQRRHRLGISVHPWSSYLDDGNRVQINFLPSNALEILFITGNSTIGRLTTAPLFRDPTAPGAFYFDWDTEDPSAADRMRLAYNGDWITDFAVRVNPPLNYDPIIAYVGPSLNVGMYHSGSGIGSFTVSDFHYVDGARPGPLAFVAPRGEHVVAVDYEGSYGPNGCHYEFGESGLGVDLSGNNRTASVVGAPERVEDTPTKTAPGHSNLYWYYAQSTISEGGRVLENGPLDVYYSYIIPAFFRADDPKGFYFEVESISGFKNAMYGAMDVSDMAWGRMSSLGAPPTYPSNPNAGYGFGVFFRTRSLVTTDLAILIDNWIEGAPLGTRGGYLVRSGRVWVHQNGVWANGRNPDTDNVGVITLARPEAFYTLVGSNNYQSKNRLHMPRSEWSVTPAGVRALTSDEMPCYPVRESGTYWGRGTDGTLVITGGEMESVTVGGTTYFNDGTARGIIDFLALGFRLISTTHNVSGTSYTWTGVKREQFKCANAVVN